MDPILIFYFFDSFVAICAALFLGSRLFSKQIANRNGWLLAYYIIAGAICMAWMLMWILHWNGFRVRHISAALEPIVLALRYLALGVYVVWLFLIGKRTHA